MELNKQSSDIIAVYPSVLRAFSYIIFGLILLITSISFISTNKQVIYMIIPFILGTVTAVYGIINLALRNRPIILFDKFGFLYSNYTHAKLFIPKDMIMAVSLRNTPNKRLIITLKQIEKDYKTYLKNIRLPSHIQMCPQNTSKLRENNIIISTENLNANNAVLSKKLQNYLNIQ